MISRITVVVSVVVGAVVHTSAQDPTKTLPDSYRVELENDHVRVVRVHYEAGAKLPEHTHPGGTTVYIYLNASEGVVFHHSGRRTHSVTRPAVTVGSMRVASGPEEHHTVENPASVPSDFLRILLKTEDDGAGRTMRRLTPSDQEYANKQLKITRLTVPGEPMPVTTTDHPALFVTLPDGDMTWLDAGRQHTLEAGEHVRLDFLTEPKPQL